MNDEKQAALDQHRTDVIAKHLAAEESRPMSYECPICHQQRSARAEEMCVSCSVAALKRFGWL